MKTNFENRLKHQVEITLCAFLDLGLQDHTLQSLVSLYSNREFTPILHIPVSGYNFKFQLNGITRMNFILRNVTEDIQ